MDNFAQCFAFTLGAEGGFTDNPSDPGNWTGGQIGQGELHGTKFGISAAAYPALDIASLTEQAAEDIYRRDYWQALHGDELPLQLARVAFDAAVNAGLHRAVSWLQQAAGQNADGVLGPVTLSALNAGNAVQLAQEALVRRLDFSTRLPGWSSFGVGWSRRIVALAGLLTQ
jgi:lysozyme family protein